MHLVLYRLFLALFHELGRWLGIDVRIYGGSGNAVGRLLHSTRGSVVTRARHARRRRVAQGVCHRIRCRVVTRVNHGGRDSVVTRVCDGCSSSIVTGVIHAPRGDILSVVSNVCGASFVTCVRYHGVHGSATSVLSSSVRDVIAGLHNVRILMVSIVACCRHGGRASVLGSMRHGCGFSVVNGMSHIGGVGIVSGIIHIHVAHVALCDVHVHICRRDVTSRSTSSCRPASHSTCLRSTLACPLPVLVFSCGFRIAF